MKYILIYAILIAVFIGGMIFWKSRESGLPAGGNKEDAIPSFKAEKRAAIATMKTNFGDIKIELFETDAPETVRNFIKLSESGFYNGVKFHRVIKDFMIQGGDPNSKDNNWSDDGVGGPGYTFADEINQHKIVKGILAMANSGPNTNGSQFFIMLADAPTLPKSYTIFGAVVEGLDVVDQIQIGDKMEKVTVE